MQPMSRRSFLRVSAATGTGLYVSLAGGPLGSARAWAAGPDPATHPATPTPGLRRPGSRPRPDLPSGSNLLPEIEHIIVLMMENHSFDNYFGLLGRGDGFTVGAGGQPVNSNPDASGHPVRATHQPTTCQPMHLSMQGWNVSHAQFDGGRNDGFVRAAGPAAMGYWTPEDLPFYSGLARTFPVADRWFASCLGPTHPNRRFLIAATAGGLIHNRRAVSTEPPPPGGTIFNLLDQHGLSWRNYYVTVPTAGLYMAAVARKENLVPVSRFFEDAKSGLLPNFSIIDPDYLHRSEESPTDISLGEAYAASVVNALMQSPAWPKTVLVWCYDEHGGYYDHVPPPSAIRPDATDPQLAPGDTPGTFDRYGFRIPAAVVSPYARPNYVSHVVHDHTSILKLVESKWNLPALTYRDANASDLLDCLDLRKPAFLVPPKLPAPANGQSISRCPTPAQGRGHVGGGGAPSADDVNVTGVADPTKPVARVESDRLGGEATALAAGATILGATAATVLVGRTRLMRLVTGRRDSRVDGGVEPGVEQPAAGGDQ
jgi:phospholipase C